VLRQLDLWSFWFGDVALTAAKPAAFPTRLEWLQRGKGVLCCVRLLRLGLRRSWCGRLGPRSDDGDGFGLGRGHRLWLRFWLGPLRFLLRRGLEIRLRLELRFLFRGRLRLELGVALQFRRLRLCFGLRLDR
jgi:hypothetical protein